MEDTGGFWTSQRTGVWRELGVGWDGMGKEGDWTGPEGDSQRVTIPV